MAKYAKPGSSRDKREIAMGAVIANLRNRHFTPEEISDEDALRVLDEIARREPQLIASQWYKTAPDSHLDIFCREWRAWCRSQQQAKWNKEAEARFWKGA